MMEHPDAFKSYIALSPSLWRSNHEIFQEIPGFEHRIQATASRPRLFIGAGSREEDAPVGMLPEIPHKDLAAELRYCRIVKNARTMNGLLSPYFNQRGVSLESKIFAGQTHNSVSWAALNDVLNFAFAALPQ